MRIIKEWRVSRPKGDTLHPFCKSPNDAPEETSEEISEEISAIPDRVKDYTLEEVYGTKTVIKAG